VRSHHSLFGLQECLGKGEETRRGSARCDLNINEKKRTMKWSKDIVKQSEDVLFCGCAPRSSKDTEDILKGYMAGE
jgi:hypothetical protein